MAEENLFVRITGSGKDLINEFKKVGVEADKTGEKVKASGEKSSSGWSKAKQGIQLAGAAIIGVAVAIGVKSVEMADQYETAHARMMVALKNTHSSWAAQGKAIDAAVPIFDHALEDFPEVFSASAPTLRNSLISP